jgi:hypothetical protein
MSVKSVPSVFNLMMLCCTGFAQYPLVSSILWGQFSGARLVIDEKEQLLLIILIVMSLPAFLFLFSWLKSSWRWLVFLPILIEIFFVVTALVDVTHF